MEHSTTTPPLRRRGRLATRAETVPGFNTTEQESSHPLQTLWQSKRYEIFWLAGAFFLLSALAFLYPPNGDDWAWGSSIGLDRLASGFENYNGRYVANLVVIFLTRATLLTPFVIAGTITGILFLVLDISKNRTSWGYAISALLLLAMPPALWRQTVSWVSGFTNYALSALFVLMFIRAIQADWRGELSPSRRTARVFGVVVFAVLASQFMENVTIFFVVATISLVIAQAVKLRRTSLDSWAWVLGSIVGAGIMFSNGAYRSAIGGDNYQKVSGLRTGFLKLFGDISQLAIVNNLALNVALATAILLICATLFRRGKQILALVSLSLGTVFIVLTFVQWKTESLLMPSSLWAFLPGISALFLLGAIVMITFALSPDNRTLVLGCLAAVLVLLAPLAFVSPIGPRLFLVTYAIMLIILNGIFRELKELLGPIAFTGLAALATVTTIGLLSSYFVIYGAISVAATHRLEFVREAAQSGKGEVTVQPLPFRQFMHTPDPSDALWEERFKLYYDLPNDLKISMSTSKVP